MWSLRKEILVMWNTLRRRSISCWIISLKLWYKRIRFLTKKYRKYTRPLLKKHRKFEHTLTQLFHIHIASSLTLYKQNYSNSLIKRSPNSSKSLNRDLKNMRICSINRWKPNWKSWRSKWRHYKTRLNLSKLLCIISWSRWMLRTGSILLSFNLKIWS